MVELIRMIVLWMLWRLRTADGTTESIWTKLVDHQLTKNLAGISGAPGRHLRWSLPVRLAAGVASMRQSARTVLVLATVARHVYSV